MAAGKNLGRYFTFKWKTVALGGIKSISLNIDGEAVDVSDADSGRWTNLLAGRRNITMDVTCNYVQNNPTQLAMTTDILAADTAGAFSFGPSGTAATGDVTYSGNGLLTNVTIDAPEEDVTEISFSLQVNGEITKAVSA